MVEMKLHGDMGLLKSYQVNQDQEFTGHVRSMTGVTSSPGPHKVTDM